MLRCGFLFFSISVRLVNCNVSTPIIWRSTLEVNKHLEKSRWETMKLGFAIKATFLDYWGLSFSLPFQSFLKGTKILSDEVWVGIN